MVRRELFDCDVCGSPDATHEEMNLGFGPHEIDLCAGCKATYMLDKLARLLEDYGVAREPQVAPEPRRNDWPCPRCATKFPERRKVLTHLATSVHGLTLVEASHECPPRGPSEICPACNYLAGAGTAIAVHMRQEHGKEAFDAWKAARA